MLFNSKLFFLFFIVVLCLHSLPLRWRAKKFNLLILSYLFYAAWSPPFVLLIMFSTLVDWIAGKRIAQTQQKTTKRLYLLLSLFVNLGILGFFKYGNFAISNLNTFLGFFGEPTLIPALKIILPIGISFYTFQSLSYTFDIYRGRTKPWHSLLDFALYITFFPQLVAGPIVRGGEFLPQCETPKKIDFDRLSLGLALLLIGLFEKVVVADFMLAPIVNGIYDPNFAVTFDTGWLGAIGFTLQIFCDFAGYSTCAIGIALTLGFVLPRNFNSPFAAIGFSDFWRRWHISLSEWLRDYLYLPLYQHGEGTMKKLDTPRVFLCLMVTMFLGGLWHGASWLFVIWGGIHGLYLCAERMISRLIPQDQAPKNPFVKMLLALVTFLLLAFSFVFFRSQSLSQALQHAGAMLGLTSQTYNQIVLASPLTFAQVLTVAVLTLIIHWRMRNSRLEDVIAKTPWPVLAISLSLMLLTILGAGRYDQPFYYFQF